MTGSHSSGVWTLPPAAYGELDAAAVRDMVVECFMHAQRERFSRIKEQMGLGTDERSLTRSATGAVRLAFAKAGGQYDAPTPEALRSVVETLARSSEAAGTPADVIAHHRQQIDHLLTRLERQSAG